ncbi:MAG: DUF4339 domain-containing protein [Planctomycetaceae bacterium]|nr:DUF4339 domain-containing protein [Planctomycetaceae bacterium]
MSDSSDQQWWLARNGQAAGPYSEEYITDGLRAGTLTAASQACPIGGEKWKPLEDWPPWADAAQQQQPPAAIPTPANDSLYESPLTSPKLPPFANWICVYAILVSPVLWVVGNFSCCITGFSLREDSPLFGLEVILIGFEAFTSLVITILLFVGGRRLRALRRSGATTIIAAIWSGLVIGFLTLLAFIGLMMAAGENSEAPSTAAGDVISFLLLMVGLCELGFVISALIWLHRHSMKLPLTAG